MEIDIRRVRNLIGLTLFILFLVLSLLILKPLASPFIAGILLAYTFYPLYTFLLRWLKFKNLVALLICALLIVAFGAGIWYSAKKLSDQAVSFYKDVRRYDIAEKVASFVSKFVITKEEQELREDLEAKIRGYVKEASNIVTRKVEDFAKGFFLFILQLFVTFFVMFYFLRDGKELYTSLYELLPFDERIKKVFEKRSEEVTKGVIYGRIVLGMIQGLFAGIGFWIFGVRQPLLFGLLATFFAIIPFIGAWLVWIPVGINLFFMVNWKLALGHLLYQFIITSNVDNLLAPLIVGKTGRMHNLAVLIGMIGGMLAFGIIGLFIGPLILEYFFLFIKVYRDYLEKEMARERKEREEKEKERERAEREKEK
ncbi:MAG: AI-2E family transporter [Candidatus Pacearchaeota archaeon]